MSASVVPVRLDLKKDSHLAIDWQDGSRSTFPVTFLRSQCPCAMCKQQREEAKTRKGGSLLKVLPGNYAGPLSAAAAELVGNYAIKIDWSDGHGSGIYSFEYLRSIDPAAR
jgi:DUF971 family protein